MDGFTGKEAELAEAIEQLVLGLNPLIRGANGLGLYVALWVAGAAGKGRGIFEPGQGQQGAPGAELRVLVFKARLAGTSPPTDRP